MSAHIKVTTTELVPGSAKPTAHQEATYELLSVPEGVRFVPLDGGATFIAAVIYVFGEFAKGLGEGLGKQIGEKLFSNGASRDQIKALLDFFTNYILREVKQEFYQDRWDAAHDLLAVSCVSLNEALVDPTRRTKDNLLSVSRGMQDGYLKLQRLGPGAYASLTRMGAAMMASDLLYANLTKEKSSYQVAWDRLGKIMQDLEDAINGLRAIKDSRVNGPYEDSRSMFCDYGPIIPIIGGDLVSPMGIDRPDPMRRGRDVVEILVPVYRVVVDGNVSQFDRRSDPCHDRGNIDATALANANATAQGARSIIDQEFSDKFQTPFELLKQEAGKLGEEIKKKL